MASFDLVYANNPGQQKVFLKVHFKMNRLAIPKLHNSQVGVESKNFFFFKNGVRRRRQGPRLT